MVNNCKTNFNETINIKKSFIEPIFDKKIGIKKPIIPIEHKPFGLMRIVVIGLITYIIFLKK